MKTLRTIGDLRAEPREGSVGLVPTMGAFHEGHLALFRAARAENDLVVASLFVNPAQFGANEDLTTYPRDEERDARVAEVKRMVRDLDHEVQLRVVPTVRDADGLALSSRNAYHSPAERELALTLP